MSAWKILLIILAVLAVVVCKPLLIGYVILVWTANVILGIYILIRKIRHG